MRHDKWWPPSDMPEWWLRTSAFLAGLATAAVIRVILLFFG